MTAYQSLGRPGAAAPYGHRRAFRRCSCLAIAGSSHGPSSAETLPARRHDHGPCTSDGTAAAPKRSRAQTATPPAPNPLLPSPAATLPAGAGAHAAQRQAARQTGSWNAGPNVPARLLPRELSPWGMFLAADVVVKVVMVGLAIASVITWTVWLAKSLELFGGASPRSGTAADPRAAKRRSRPRRRASPAPKASVAQMVAAAAGELERSARSIAGRHQGARRRA